MIITSLFAHLVARRQWGWRKRLAIPVFGALPESPELVAELTTPTYFFKGDRLQIEDKDQVKERLGRSPDLADALGLTFAAEVRKLTPLEEARKNQPRKAYSPFDRM